MILVVTEKVAETVSVNLVVTENSTEKVNENLLVIEKVTENLVLLRNWRRKCL